MKKRLNILIGIFIAIWLLAMAFFLYSGLAILEFVKNP